MDELADVMKMTSVPAVRNVGAAVRGSLAALIDAAHLDAGVCRHDPVLGGDPAECVTCAARRELRTIRGILDSPFRDALSDALAVAAQPGHPASQTVIERGVDLLLATRGDVVEHPATLAGDG